MTNDRIVKGVALLSVTVLVWGATFPIGKDAVARIDPYWLSALRYLVVAPLFVLVLWAVEGRRALSYEGKLRLAALVGCVGFGGFNLFTFSGMQHTTAAHAAIIMALQAPLTAIVHWMWRGVQPARPTIVCMTLALTGVLLVITKGDIASAIAGGSLFGDALVFLGASSWVQICLHSAGYKFIVKDGMLILNNPHAIKHPDDIAHILVNAGTSPTHLAVVQQNLEEHFMQLTSDMSLFQKDDAQAQVDDQTPTQEEA